MQFSTADKSLYVKLVYYGPALSGKTTNLETIHRLTDPRRRQPMVSLRTEGDRTLFFDLLPFDLGQLFGLNVRIKLYTVPGQIQYDTTRRQVLAGADGVVFVADSSPRQRENNRVMLRNLQRNLTGNGLDPQKLPIVLQWNKRDLADALPAGELDAELNWRRLPTHEAVATTGVGVMETFREVTVQTLEALAQRSPSLGDRMKVAELRHKVETIFAGFIEAARRTAAFLPAAPIAGPASPAAPRPTPDPAGGPRAAEERADARPDLLRQHLGLDELLGESVQANLAFSERLVADASREQLWARVRRERRALSGAARLALGATDLDGVARVALRAAQAGLEVGRGSVLQAVGPRIPLREIAVAGHPRDPLNSIVAPGVGSAASAVLERGETAVFHDPTAELLFGQPHPALEGIRGVLALPILAGRGLPPLLVLLYADATTRDFDADDAEFAAAVGSVVALALRGAVQAAPRA